MADLAKLVDDLSALTIMEASELKKMLEEKWGVTAATGGGMMMMAGGATGGAAAPAAAAEPVEEQSEFKVIITDVGAKKINVIKAVRQVTNLGLKEAKDLVETANAVVVEGVSKDKAQEAKTVLEAEGAKVEVK